ncbi:MAG: acyltransferase [Bacteroidetes bacterium]|nr:acyltransferase [Bacteroidota bacterium]
MDLKSNSRVNNFDLIRLLAAFEVVLFHGLEHLKINYHQPGMQPIFSFIAYFPGVPIFFCISGFLIYNSFKRNSNDIRKYFKNRFLRLYPGLWMCFIATMVLLFLFGILTFSDLGNRSILGWIACQTTFFQFYTPPILRSWGVGTPNGSLWTLTVEVQFYILVPLLFYVIRASHRYKNLLFGAIIALSVLTCFFFKQWDAHNIRYKLGEVFVLPYLYNFLFGVIIAEYWDRLKPLFVNRFLFWLALYVVWVLLFGFYFKSYQAGYWPKNVQGFAGILILSMLTISAAYSNVSLSTKILRGRDISYGVYIYHMLIVNSAVALGLTHNFAWLLIVFLTTITISYLSWILIESKALKMKSSRVYETDRTGY